MMDSLEMEGKKIKSRVESKWEKKKERLSSSSFLFSFSECKQVCVGEKLRHRHEVGEMRHADGYIKEES